MSPAALALPHGLSLVAITEMEAPGWTALFRSAAPAHIPYHARTPAERKLLGLRLDDAVMRADRGVLLVAQGASCFATAWWARLSPASYVSRVAGALFFEPVEDERTNIDDLLDTFASPRTRLPFPSVVLGADASRRDLLPSVRTIADSWGSRMVLDRHADQDSPWRRTRRAIERFTLAVVERDVRLVEARLAR